jgi:hypothetical protein
MQLMNFQPLTYMFRMRAVLGDLPEMGEPLPQKE